MNVPAVHQVLAGYAEGDAISQEARRIRDAARRLGHASDIFAPADRIAPDSAGDCRSLDEYDDRAGDRLVYHYALASPACRVFERSRAVRILRYHNITPAEFFDGFDDAVAAQLRAGRDRLATVAAAAGSVWADSEFNAAELRDLGLGGVRVLPLLFAPVEFDVAPDPATLARFGGTPHNVVFVGRIAPNKRVEDLILAFAWLNRCIDPAARLVLVGSERSCPRYYAMLRWLAGRLDLRNVCFEGFASHAQLAAVYRRAGVFACASLHEGYCLPLIEAMCHDVPVVARARGGMPEAMGGAGVLYDDLPPEALAELLHAAMTDAALRGEILASQSRRVAEVRARDLAADCRRLAGLED